MIQVLLRKGVLPVNRAQQLLHWKHSGFNLHRGERIEAHHRAELEHIAQCIIRNPFSADKMVLENRQNTGWTTRADLWHQPNRPEAVVIYHSKLNPKVKGNFVVFSATEFLAAVTQHIPDKGFQVVRYYGLYSNKYRGQHPTHSECHSERSEESLNQTALAGCPEQNLRRRLPPKEWRDLIRCCARSAAAR